MAKQNNTNNTKEAKENIDEVIIQSIYKFNPKYKGQNVTAFLNDNDVVYLERATQEQLKKAYEHGNQKFISIK